MHLSARCKSQPLHSSGPGSAQARPLLSQFSIIAAEMKPGEARNENRGRAADFLCWRCAREMQQQYGPIHIEFNETSFFISSRYFAEYSSHSHAAPAPAAGFELNRFKIFYMEHG